MPTEVVKADPNQSKCETVLNKNTLENYIPKNKFPKKETVIKEEIEEKYNKWF